MSNSVIVAVANDAYIPQAKSLFVNCIRRGNWQGDFCLVTTSTSDDCSGRGIVQRRILDRPWNNFVKFEIFADYFKQWDRVLYLDCDVLVQDDLNQMFDRLAEEPPALYFDGCHDASILKDWEHFDKLHGTGPDSHPERYAELRERFPHIDKLVLTSDVVWFRPGDVPTGTVANLVAIGEEFLDLNPARMDQQVMNLLLYDKMAPLSKDYCTWWAFDDPGNRVPCEARGWRGDEFPTVIHYWSMYAPWLVKTPDAGAYFNHRLDRVCHELYAENLSLFDETFPRKDTHE